MPSLKHNPTFLRTRNFIMILLIGVLSLTSSAFASPQTQTTDPFAKRMPADGVRDPLPEADEVVLAATALNAIKDPSFEKSYGSTAYWGQYSENFGTPLCTAADCGNGGGTARPRTGSVWGWFGGVDFSKPGTSNPEGAELYQYVTIPSCGATLKFYFWIGKAGAGSNSEDFFVVRLNSRRLFLATATQKSTYPGYKLVTVDIAPGTFTPGNQNILYFGSVVSDQIVTFNLDDITLTPKCLMVSGNAGAPGATIKYTGGSTTTDWDGRYTFNVSPGWSGTVTPSKMGTNFAPTKRTYTNLVSYQLNQNYTATPILYPISGNTGVANTWMSYLVSSGYMGGYSAPNGSYSVGTPYGWGGAIMPLHDCYTFTPVERTYNNVTAAISGQDYTPTFNTGTGCADITVDIGGVPRGRFGLEAYDSTRANFTGVDSGPVEITSSNLVPLFASERLIYKVDGVPVSFSEMMALPASQLDTTYWLPWYNSKTLDTQLRFANVSPTDATVQVSIGDVDMEPFILTPGGSARKTFPNIDKGPVKIVSDVDIVAAERVIYNVNGVDTSFTELMAMPAGSLDNTYWLPWYNSKTLDTQLRIANVSDLDTTVRLTIGAMALEPITILAGESKRLTFPNIDQGPVRIVSDQEILATERVIYNVNGVGTSYSELMALPASQLDTTYWLPWYNSKTLDTQLRITNVSIAEASVQVYFQGIEVSGSPFPLGPGTSKRLTFPNTDKGPVKIVSDQDIVVTERVIYSLNGVPTSFSEMMAIGDGSLDTIYWLPWYNNKDLDTQLRIGVR